jgi:hypothetical protein
VKILLDECVDRCLARDFIGYEVSTVERMGWKPKQNGELLALAAKDFEVFVNPWGGMALTLVISLAAGIYLPLNLANSYRKAG